MDKKDKKVDDTANTRIYELVPVDDEDDEEKTNIKKNIVIVCFIAILIGTFLLSMNKREEQEQAKERKEFLSLIQSKIEDYNRYSTEETIYGWKFDYKDTSRELFEDYVTTADEMIKLLEEKGFDFDKIQDSENFLKILQNAEKEGFLIRYDLSVLDLAYAGSLHFPFMQLDASKQSNEIVEIWTDFDRVVSSFIQAVGEGEKVVVKFEYNVYSYDEYLPDFEQDDLGKISTFYEENLNNGIRGKDLFTLKQAYVATIDFTLAEYGHAIIEGTRYITEDKCFEPFKLHLDCNNPTAACIFAFDEDYEDTKNEIARYAEIYLDDWEWEQ